MIQEFFKTTVISKFIKQLLAKSPVPIYKLIFDNDEMVKGCIYAYKDKILRCIESGRFTGIRGTLDVNNYLCVQEPLRVDDTTMTTTVYDYVTDEYKYNEVPFAVTDDWVGVRMYTPAKFEIINQIEPDTYVPGVTETFRSNSTHYDEETHYRLGEYLRYLNNQYDLDLMPLYNCFTYKMATNLHLDGSYKNGFITTSDSRYKVYLIPIKFNKTYTIALDSDFPVKMKAVFYNKGVMTDSETQEYLPSYLNENVITYNNTQFSKPFTYTLSSAQTVWDIDGKSVSYYKKLHNVERYLYLAIQVSASNNSSVVVLEGDYTHTSSLPIADVIGVEYTVSTSDEVSSMLTSNLSLLAQNDNQQHPFADKLIEYLLGNTIDTREYIDENVAAVEQAVDYNPKYRGMWDDNIRYILFERYMKLQPRDDLNFTDILGYVDSDIERAIRKGYLAQTNNYVVIAINALGDTLFYNELTDQFSLNYSDSTIFKTKDDARDAFARIKKQSTIYHNIQIVNAYNYSVKGEAR